jgi:P-type E1-E2 ATPase
MEAVRLFVEGVHCQKCLGKLEALPNHVSGLSHVRFDMSAKTLTAQIEGPDLTDLALQEAVEQLGFKAHILEGSDHAARLRVEDDRRDLLRIGVAAVASGNVMLMAISTYAGADAVVVNFMSWLSFCLATPAAVFSAWPLHRAAWADLKRGRPSVDLPISAAVIAGFALSLWSLLKGQTTVYFDSITLLILLVLSSRYLLKRIQRHFLSDSRFRSLFKITAVEALSPNGLWTTMDPRHVKVGAQVRVPVGQAIPFDGTLISDIGEVDASLLTGEVRPQPLRAHDPVFMGMKNLGRELVIKVAQPLQASRVHGILAEVEKTLTQKPRSLQILDQVGAGFVSLVFAGAAAVVIYFIGTAPLTGLERALALVLVSCPCTFAFGVPLILSLAMTKAARFGALVKHQSVFEKLLSIKDVILDKTGTVTTGRYSVLSVTPGSAPDLDFSRRDLLRLKGLVTCSVHPVARAVARYIENQEFDAAPAEVPDRFEEKPTVGLLGEFGADTYLVNAEGVMKNGKTLFRYTLGDSLFPEARQLVEELREQTLPVFLLSGDRGARVSEVAAALDVDPENVFSAQTPEQKNEFLQRHPHSLMIGDGANDSLALASSAVGVAVQGSLASSLRAADVYLLQPDLTLVLKLQKLARAVQRAVRRNLTLAVAYNLMAATLAIMGLITPLWAAVLMPMSTLSQVASGLFVLRGES